MSREIVSLSSALMSRFEDHVCDPTIIYGDDQEMTDNDLENILRKFQELEDFNVKIKTIFGAEQFKNFVRQTSHPGR